MYEEYPPPPPTPVPEEYGYPPPLIPPKRRRKPRRISIRKILVFISIIICLIIIFLPMLDIVVKSSICLKPFNELLKLKKEGKLTKLYIINRTTVKFYSIISLATRSQLKYPNPDRGEVRIYLSVSENSSAILCIITAFFFYFIALTIAFSAFVRKSRILCMVAGLLLLLTFFLISHGISSIHNYNANVIKEEEKRLRDDLLSLVTRLVKEYRNNETMLKLIDDIYSKVGIHVNSTALKGELHENVTLIEVEFKKKPFLYLIILPSILLFIAAAAKEMKPEEYYYKPYAPEIEFEEYPPPPEYPSSQYPSHPPQYVRREYYGEEGV